MSTEGGAARRVLTRDEECALSELSPYEFKSRLRAGDTVSRATERRHARATGVGQNRIASVSVVPA